MSEQDVPAENEPYSAPPPAAAPPRSPFGMLIFTGISALLIVLAFTFHGSIEDATGHGIDVVMVGSVFFSIGVLALWVLWVLLLSRWKWSWRIITASLLIAVPISFMKVFRPVNGGDATIVGFEPIWNERPEVAPVTVEPSAAAVDLATETPDDFPQFLGPAGNGTVPDGPQIDANAFGDSKILWKQPIGRGWSGFSARNGFAVTMEQREDKECVTCYRIEDGELLWTWQHTVRHQDQMNLGRVGPRATPTIHEGRVYAVGAVGAFACLDGATGEPVWLKDLNDLLGLSLASETDSDGMTINFEENSRLAWGRSGSPLIVDDLVIIPGGGPQNGPIHTLLAFHKTSGELLWKAGEEMIAYGSPSLAEVAGRRQILMTAETQAMGFDAETGEVLWTHSRPGETNGGANTSQVTVVSDSQVLTSKGYPDGGGELISLTNSDGKISTERVWRNDRVLKTKLMSPVVLEGHAYSLSNGFMECTRLSDGERIWKRRGRFGHGQLLLLKDLILLHSEFGNLFLIRPTPDGYEELGSLPTIDGVCWNTICLYGNRLLVRSELEAACIELPVR